jgi:hypothetical protein
MDGPGSPVIGRTGRRFLAYRGVVSDKERTDEGMNG